MNFVCHKPDAELFSYTLSLCLFNLHNCNLNNSFFLAVLADRERSRMNNRRNNHLVLVEVHCCNWHTRKTTDMIPRHFFAFSNAHSGHFMVLSIHKLRPCRFSQYFIIVIINSPKSRNGPFTADYPMCHHLI